MGYKQTFIDGKLVLARNGKANGHAPRFDALAMMTGGTPFQQARIDITRRANLSYDAARTGTDLDNHWKFADSLDADSSHSSGVRQKLRDRSRYEQGSNGYYDGIINTHCNMVVGVGPTLRMLTKNRDFNQLVEREFFAWSQAVQLRRKLWAMCHARTGDGECLAILQTNPGLQFPPNLSNEVLLDLLPIEAEQCQTPFERIDKGRIDGVWYDDFNNVVAYDILPAHPGSTNSFFTSFDAITVSASTVLHWFKLKRPGAHRGVPDMTSTLNVGATSRRHREATVAAAETAADIAALLTTNVGPAGDSEPDPVAPFSSVEFAKRMLMMAPMGWNVNQMKGEHPNAEFANFHRLQISEQARPISMPYNAAACDSSTYSFASGKLDTLCYRAAIDVERQDCNDLVLDPLFAAWFKEWTLVSNQPFTPTHQWDWPTHPVIDAVSESTATDTRLKNGTLTLRQAYSDQGQDLEDQLAIMAEDTFGEATDETIQKCRQIVTLKNAPRFAVEHVAQILGLAPVAKGAPSIDQNAQDAGPPDTQANQSQDDYAIAYLGWVTLGNGVHVEIGEDGEITKGPGSMRGKTVEQVTKEQTSGAWPDSKSAGKSNSRISIDSAKKELAKHGWILGDPVPFKAGDKTTTYKVTHEKTGNVVYKTAKEIRDFVSH